MNYAKRQQGRRIVAGQSTHLPLKLNMAGVIPPIFASSIILFPSTIVQWFGQNDSLGWLGDIALCCSRTASYMLYCIQLRLFSFASFIQH